MQKLGFGPEQLAELRPGIICVPISCLGPTDRSAIARLGAGRTDHDRYRNEGLPDRPALLPAAACDYTTGYLAAYGVLLALARRATEGGSYHVRVSLCQSGMFIYRQGNVTYDAPEMDLTDAELRDLRIETKPASGPLRHLGPVLQLSETPRWIRPTPVLGGDTLNGRPGSTTPPRNVNLGIATVQNFVQATRGNHATGSAAGVPALYNSTSVSWCCAYMPMEMNKNLQSHSDNVGVDYMMDIYPVVGHGFCFPGRCNCASEADANHCKS